MLAIVLLLGVTLNVSGFYVKANAVSSLSAPKNLRVPALAYDEKSITLVWDKPDNYANIDDYNVYMNGKKIGSANEQSSPAKKHMDPFYNDPSNSQQVKVSLHNFTAENLQPSTSYTFTVRAVDKDGNESADSNQVTQSTTAVPKVFNIVDYGAVGDGTIVNTKAIQAAIDACTPGGKVLIPKGIFKSGSIWLKSDMTLEVDGTLIGSENPYDYPYHNKLYDYSTDEAFYSLINAVTYDYGTLQNIRIVGPGTIDGNGWKQNGTDQDGFYIAQKGSQATVGDLGILAAAQVAKASSEFGNDSPYPARSSLITLRGVKNVYYGGFTAQNPANHTLVNVQDQNVTVNGLNIVTFDANNGDGIEFNQSNGLNVFNNYFNTGDDDMNFAAGLGEASTHQNPSENAWIFNNYFGKGHGAVVAGSHTGAWIQNILAEDNVINGTDIGLRCKTNPTNGGGARNILFRDNAMKDLAAQGFIFTSSYSDPNAAIQVEPASSLAQFTNITVKNVTVDGTAKEAINVAGLQDQSHNNIHFEDVKFLKAKPTKIDFLKDSSFTNVTFNNVSNPWVITNSSGLTFDGTTTLTAVTNDASQGPVWPSESQLTSSVKDDTSVTLNWNAATDNAGVKNYEIFKGSKLVATVPGNINSYQVTGLSPALTYNFKVEAADATGNVTTNGPGITVSTTGTKDTTAPIVPTGDNTLSLSPVTGSLGTSWARVNWSPATDNYGIDQYEIYVNGEKKAEVSSDTTAYTITKLNPGTHYVIQVKAVDETGNGTMYGSSVDLTTNPLYDTSAPKWPEESQIHAQAITQTSVKLSWNPAHDDQQVTGYRLYVNGKPIEGDVKFTPINTANTTTDLNYRVEGLALNTTYTFKVEAGDKVGKWSGSGPSITITTKGPQNGQ